MYFSHYMFLNANVCSVWTTTKSAGLGVSMTKRHVGRSYRRVWGSWMLQLSGWGKREARALANNLACPPLLIRQWLIPSWSRHSKHTHKNTRNNQIKHFLTQNAYKTNKKQAAPSHSCRYRCLYAFTGVSFKQLYPSLPNIHSSVTDDWKKSLRLSVGAV